MVDSLTQDSRHICPENICKQKSKKSYRVQFSEKICLGGVYRAQLFGNAFNTFYFFGMNEKIDFLDFRISVLLDFWIVFGFLAISWERKDLLESHWCQNNWIFKGFSNFQ